METHLNDEALAERWGTSVTAVRIQRHRGDFPRYIKRGTRVVTPLAEVERWEAEHLVDPRPKGAA